MSKFILIDHSLAGHGGHHYECARLILLAAESAGLQTATATHVDFQPNAGWPVVGSVSPTFHLNAYTKQAVITGSAETPVDPYRPRSSLRHVAHWWRRPSVWHESLRIALRMRRLRRRIHREIEALGRFWRAIDVRPGDQVFLQTVSDFDLHWICRFLAATPSTRDNVWHLQFHNNFLRGRESDYASQSKQLEAMRDHFQSLLALVPKHRLHLYCTTQALADQFNLLGVGPFHVLECPANPELWRSSDSKEVPAQSPRRDAPLKVVCGGYGRDEKGWRQLDRVLADVWGELFESGQCQLQVQATLEGVEKSVKKPKKFRVERVDVSPYADVSRVVMEQLQAAFRSDSRATAAAAERSSRNQPLRCVPYPLSTPDYVEFLRGADIGLFLYDPVRYYSRYSAVLAEMLCVGVPVIVPAASWLAEQISGPNEKYLAELFESAAATAGDLVQREPRRAEVARSSSAANELLVRFIWDSPPAAGEFARVTLVQRDAAGNSLRSTPFVARPPAAATAAHCLVPLDDATQSITLEWRHAFTESASGCRVDGAKFLGRLPDGDGHRPRGAVGLVFCEPEQVGELLREMTRCFPHYLDNARRHAATYRERLTPDAILAGLLRRADSIPVEDSPAVA